MRIAKPSPSGAGVFLRRKLRESEWRLARRAAYYGLLCSRRFVVGDSITGFFAIDGFVEVLKLLERIGYKNEWKQ